VVVEIDKSETHMTADIRFLLNGVERRVDAPSPTLTVLEYLRLTERATGTKEGCAEGDCGACTVVLGEVADERMRWRAVNACIALIGQLDGKAVLTAEGLGEALGAAHPVQDAMVRHHASQCGFCTPGFVMALFAFHHGGEPGDEAVIHDALAGNLCRCTGYRPIVDAARDIAGGPRDRFLAEDAAYVARLAALARPEPVAIERDGRRFFAPTTPDQVVDILSRHPHAHILAGGTDLGLEVTKKNRKLETVLWLGACAELRGVEDTDVALTLGAAVTYTDALPYLDRHWSSFATLVRRIGSRQIRNHGTVCGNLANASPIGDTPPALIALGAEIILRGGEGVRTMPLEQFFLDYRKTALRSGEFVAAIRIPKPDPRDVFRVYKISKRYDQDISAVCAAFRFRLENGVVQAARIAYGGMAATPVRAASLEQAITGKAWTEGAARSLAEAAESVFTPLSDFRASAAYRAKLAGNLVLRFHLETAGAAAGEALEVVGL